MARQDQINKTNTNNFSLNQLQEKKLIELIIKEVIKALKDGRRIELRGFGVFFVKKIKEKFSGRNPKTGELIYIPAKNKVRFKPSNYLKKYINE